jgi:hypothetical protein
VKDKQDHTRLMGFGHRVYKNYDPRAKVMRQTCHEVLTSLGIKHDPLLELAMEMEQIALKDEYFISKKLYPNVDFYSGIIFRAIGIPTSMFTVLFAWRAPSAGSLSGTRCWRIPIPRSAVRASSMPVRRNGRTSHCTCGDRAPWRGPHTAHAGRFPGRLSRSRSRCRGSSGWAAPPTTTRARPACGRGSSSCHLASQRRPSF